MTPVSLPWDSRIGRRLKLRDLHILFATMRWGSMAKAADHLGMSQPAVSEAIANLENVLGVRLLDRSPRGVEPTIYAEALLKRGHVVFDELRQGMQDIEFLANPTAGEVRIGCTEAFMAGFVPMIIDQLSRRYPNVVVHVVTAQAAAQDFQELRERSVDLMLGRIFRPVVADDIAVETICEDRHVFVVAGAKSPWARRRKIALSELVHEPWILYPADNVVGSYYAQVFHANGLELPAKGVVGYSFQVRMHLLATGRFLTMMRGLTLQDIAKRGSLKALPIDLNATSVPVAIFTLKNRTASPVVQLFIDHARAVAKTMTKTSLSV